MSRALSAFAAAPLGRPLRIDGVQPLRFTLGPIHVGIGSDMQDDVGMCPS